MLLRICLFAFVAMLVMAAPANAGFAVYQGADWGATPFSARPNSDAAAANFAANSAALTTIDFEAAPLSLFAFSSLSETDLAVPGVSMNALGAAGFYVNPRIAIADTPLAGFNTTPGGDRFVRVGEFGLGNPDVGVGFDFTDPIYSFGAFFTGVGTEDGIATIEFDDGSLQIINLQGDGSDGVQFLGFTSGTGVQSVAIWLRPENGSNDDWFGIDDVMFSTQPVPEPVSLAVWSMLGVAGAAFGLRRRG